MEIVPWNREKEEEKHQIRSTNEEIHERKHLFQRVDGLSTTRGNDEHREVEKTTASSGGSSVEWRQRPTARMEPKLLRHVRDGGCRRLGGVVVVARGQSGAGPGAGMGGKK